MANSASTIVGGTVVFLEAMVDCGVGVICSAEMDWSASEVTSTALALAGEALARLLVGVTGHENLAGLVRYV